MTATIPAGEGWIAHAPGNGPPNHVTDTLKGYEGLRRNGQSRDADEISESYWIVGGSHARGVIAYRLACPVARERIAELEAEVERLRGETRQVFERVLEVAPSYVDDPISFAAVKRYRLAILDFWKEYR